MQILREKCSAVLRQTKTVMLRKKIQRRSAPPLYIWSLVRLRVLRWSRPLPFVSYLLHRLSFPIRPTSDTSLCPLMIPSPPTTTCREDDDCSDSAVWSVTGQNRPSVFKAALRAPSVCLRAQHHVCTFARHTSASALREEER